MAISEKGRRERFEQWEKLGLEAVKDDLRTGGLHLIGGPPEVRELAWEWVRMKEAEREEAETVTPKPSLGSRRLRDHEAGWVQIQDQ